MCPGDDGASVSGYAMMRPARIGWWVGPLFADSAEVAAGLLDALAADLGPDDELHVDISEHRGAALELADFRGLAVRSHTVRMYNGPVPPVRAEATWGVTSLELG